jgi:hypothetical protein
MEKVSSPAGVNARSSQAAGMPAGWTLRNEAESPRGIKGVLDAPEVTDLERATIRQLRDRSGYWFGDGDALRVLRDYTAHITRSRGAYIELEFRIRCDGWWRKTLLGAVLFIIAVGACSRLTQIFESFTP